ncbi:hypothetical protein [Herbaspirillum sp. SJZ107]|uniref:hypothetical protein n=1 Tax=Herbaspirillum sp. SJZ107 TaxID=2572881 RepID=UPI0011535A49|nr:hypothetical protein [Herbaspirillum sp. SJZ107]TQK05371.1 hypothetical protein FBX97_4345 [Herbaspirillum sp. SJZ107]
MNKPLLVLALGSAMVLSACGGGGGGGSTGGGTTTPPVTTTPPPATSTQSSITAANATSAASNAYAATTSVGASSTSLTDILTGVNVNRANINTVAPLLKLVKRAYGGQQLLTGVTQTQTQQCPGGGSLTIDATISNANNVSNGDILKVTANNCVDGTDTLSGAFTVNFSGVTGDINTPVFGVTMDSTFTNFSIVSGTDKVGVNGDMKVVLNQTSANNNTIVLSGNSLQTTEQQGSAAVVNRTVTAYTVKGKTENGVESSGANFGLSGTSPKLGTFSYTVKSLADFVFSSPTAVVPSSGSLIVTGNASSVTATVVPNGVRVDFSASGNGTITNTETVAWAAFLSSI